MVYEEDVRPLTQGMVLLWNEWRKKEVLKRRANAHGTDFSIDLRGIDLSYANLQGIDLSHANLRKANLSQADLRGANLSGTDLSGANLNGANFESVFFGETTLAEQDLTEVLHLETIRHVRPSHVDCTTVTFPPMSSALATFLRGIGRSLSLIAALEGRAMPVDNVLVNLFLGYSETDQTFADDLRPHIGLLKPITLTEEGVALSCCQGRPNIQAIEKAHLIILLVSAPFLASSYVQTHIIEPALRQTKEGGILVPVIVRPTAWQESPLQGLQPLPTQGLPLNQWSNRDAALYDIAQGLQRLVQTFHTRLLDQAAQQRHADEVLAQLLHARTTLAQHQKKAQGTQTVLDEAKAAVVEAQTRLMNAQKNLEAHVQQQHDLQQTLRVLQETEIRLFHQCTKLANDHVPVEPPSMSQEQELLLMKKGI